MKNGILVYANEVKPGEIIWNEDWGYCMRLSENLPSSWVLHSNPDWFWFVILEKPPEYQKQYNRQGESIAFSNSEKVWKVSLDLTKFLEESRKESFRE